MPPEGDKQSCRHSVTGLVEYNGTERKRRGPPFSSSQSLVQVRSHRADSGLVLRLKAGLGLARLVEHASESN